MPKATKVSAKKSGRIRIASSEEEDVVVKKTGAPAEDDADETSEDTEETEEETSEEAEETESVPEVSTRKSRRAANLVDVVCIKEVDPAPVVGEYRFSDYRIMKLEEKKPYSVPAHVAEHLVDKKVAVLIS